MVLQTVLRTPLAIRFPVSVACLAAVCSLNACTSTKTTTVRREGSSAVGPARDKPATGRVVVVSNAGPMPVSVQPIGCCGSTRRGPVTVVPGLQSRSVLYGAGDELLVWSAAETTFEARRYQIEYSLGKEIETSVSLDTR
ncbi:MAG: hypothetical protein H7Y88_08540 [Phycisphaerales bacterium]|nr:hypothetical protein [Phycisphaerales bacterium]